MANGNYCVRYRQTNRVKTEHTQICGARCAEMPTTELQHASPSQPSMAACSYNGGGAARALWSLCFYFLVCYGRFLSGNTTCISLCRETRFLFGAHTTEVHCIHQSRRPCTSYYLCSAHSAYPQTPAPAAAKATIRPPAPPLPPAPVAAVVSGDDAAAAAAAAAARRLPVKTPWPRCNPNPSIHGATLGQNAMRIHASRSTLR